MSLLLAALLSAPAQAAPGWTIVLPLGVPQFTHDRSARGWMHAGIQTLAAGATTYATFQMLDFAESGDIDSELTWRMISAGTVAVFGVSYTISVIDGSRLHQLQLESEEASASVWVPRLELDDPRAELYLPPPPPLAQRSALAPRNAGLDLSAPPLSALEPALP